MIPVLGLGAVFAGGQGTNALTAALRGPFRTPAPREGGGFALTVDLAAVGDKSLLGKIRRADRLSKMAVLAATGALADNSPGGERSSQAIRSGSLVGPADVQETDYTGGRGMGIIVATAYGPHETTFAFLNDILDFGDINVSPTRFSNSVHNAAASYITETLGLKCPTLTVTRFQDSFHGALELAASWIAEGRCARVLVGAVDTCGDVLRYVAGARLTAAPDGVIRPFDLDSPVHVPGEGALFLLVGEPGGRSPYCSVEAVPRGEPAGKGVAPDLRIIAADGLLTDSAPYAGEGAGGTLLAAYSPVFGSMMIQSAFAVAAGALMIRDGIRYASPVIDNPRGFNVLAETRREGFGTVECVGYNCQAERSAIFLRKGGKSDG
jgi:3-oxoacyl-[acyl-carrier-protein] synthase II